MTAWSSGGRNGGRRTTAPASALPARARAARSPARRTLAPRALAWVVPLWCAGAALTGGCDRTPAVKGGTPATGPSRPTVVLSETVQPPETDPAKILYRAMVLQRDPKVVREVLAAHPRLANEPINGSPPLALACRSRSPELVSALLDGGADPNAKDAEGWTILWTAVQFEDVRAIKHLTEKKADIKARQGDGETLLWAAETREMARFLIDAGVDPGAKDKFGDTALHAACRGSRRDVVEVLLDAGLAVDTPGRWGMRPLHSAACTLDGDPRPVVALLLARGADINSKGYKGHTALHECAFFNRTEMVDFLIARGSATDARDDDGLTPAQLARLAGAKAFSTQPWNYDTLERAKLINLLIDNGGGKPEEKLPIPKY